MQDDAAPYMDRCRELGIDEHAQVIVDWLEQRYDPDPGGDRPHDKDAFLAAWRLLRQKVDAMPPDPPAPLSPLEKAYRKRRRTKDLLNWAPGDPKFSKKDIYKMQKTLAELNREIDYMEERGGYNTRPAHPADTPRQDAARKASRIFAQIENVFEPQPTGRIHWQPLPRPEATPQRIRRHYRERLHLEGRLDKYDEERLTQATALPYVDWWVPTEGFGGFDAYSIFTFDHTTKVLLECPIYGNAAYVINADMEVWREMKKQELIESGLAENIPHQGEHWPAKIRHALDLE